MILTLLLITVIFCQRGYGDAFNACITPPLKCPNDNITFWLYTRNTQNSPQLLNISDPDSIIQANFIPNAPVKLLIHGYTGSKDFDPNTDARPAYFRRGDYNVISLDYSPLVMAPCYKQAVQNVPLVSLCVAQMIDYLVKTKLIPLRAFHVIGMSLGAHVSGEISNWLLSGKLERVTGLDPALPLFVTDDITMKLDKSDAKFVDIIHTNGLAMGKLEPTGHVDFYLNGGLIQPGCDQYKNIRLDPALQHIANDFKQNTVDDIQTNSLGMGKPESFDNVDFYRRRLKRAGCDGCVQYMNKSANGCSHWRAALYFAESINTDVGFYAKRCDSWLQYTFGLCNLYRYPEEILMGEFASNAPSGLYFLYTNSRAPFARGAWPIQPPQKQTFNDYLVDSDYADIPFKNIELLSQNITEMESTL